MYTLLIFANDCESNLKISQGSGFWSRVYKPSYLCFCKQTITWLNNDYYTSLISHWIRSLLVRKRNQPNYLYLYRATLRNIQLALAVDSSIQISRHKYAAKICSAFHDRLLLFYKRLWRDDDFLADLLHNVRTCNFYQTTLFANAVYAMALCLSVCLCLFRRKWEIY